MIRKVHSTELKAIKLFRDVENNVLEYLAGQAEREYFTPKQSIIKQDTVDENIYFVKRGVFQLQYKDLLSIMRHQGFRYTGNQIGLAGALAKRKHYANTVALTQCEVIYVTRARLLNAMPFSPTLIENSYIEIAARFHTLMEHQQWGTILPDSEESPLPIDDDLTVPGKTSASASARVLQRVAAFLVEWERTRLANDVELAALEGVPTLKLEQLPFRLDIELGTQQDVIGKLIGVHHTDVSRAFSHLSHYKYIDRKYGKSSPVTRIDVDKIQDDFFPRFEFPDSELTYQISI